MIMVFKLNFNLLMPLILVYVYNVFSRKYDFKWLFWRNLRAIVSRYLYSLLLSQKGSIGTLISYLYSKYVQNTIIICWILSKYIFKNENIFMVKMIFHDRSWINHDETRWILVWYAICQGLYFDEDVEILRNIIFHWILRT